MYFYLHMYIYIYHDGSKFSLLMNVFSFKFTKVHNKTVFSCPNGFSPNIKGFHQRKQEEFTWKMYDFSSNYNVVIYTLYCIDRELPRVYS